jgi:bacterioferritin-associated ferredoxin
MEWQPVAVVAFIITATVYLGRATWKTWFGSKAGCGSGCGKCSTTTVDSTNTKRRSLPQV